MKKENGKQKLFENLMKLNPDLKNNPKLRNILIESQLYEDGVKFRAEVTGKGENRWSGNAMEYDTEDEAKQWLDGLAGRWFGFDMSRVVPVSVPKGQPVDFENDEFYQNFRAGLNERTAPRLEEDHLNTKEDQLDFLVKVMGIMQKKEHSEEEAELLKAGWRELPDEKINAFYSDIEDQFKKRGIDPHSLNEKDDKWIQKAVDPKHKGYCTPMTKDTCTPARKAFAKRAKAGDLEEDISIDVEAGDTIMTGRFKNKRTVVKTIGKDEHGMPTINGKKVVTFRKGVKDESVIKEGMLSLPTKTGESIEVEIPNKHEIFVNGQPIEELLEGSGDVPAIGNFAQPIDLSTYFQYITKRPEGVSEETFHNNRLFRVNLEELVKAYNEDKNDFFENKGIDETVETWKNDIAPSNQEHFVKQAQGLGMSPQEMYDEMKAEEDNVSPQQLNEAQLSREDMMAALKSKFGLSHVDTTDNFYQDSSEGQGGIWLSGENGETASDGRELFDYYSTNYSKYDLGVHNEFQKFCEDNGWYPEWNDPGTLMLWSDSMNEGKFDDYDDEDDPDAGHTVNGELLSPEEYRKWKEEEGEYDDMDRERYRNRRPNW